MLGELNRCICQKNPKKLPGFKPIKKESRSAPPVSGRQAPPQKAEKYAKKYPKISGAESKADITVVVLIIAGKSSAWQEAIIGIPRPLWAGIGV